MVFSEVYGSYFNTVAAILDEAIKDRLTDKKLHDVIQRYAFGESMLTIPQALKQQAWPLLNSDGTTPIKNEATMPLTTLQKQWMKAILQDPRIKLFQPSEEGLEDVEPLYEQGTFVYFDRYSDGDPFEDEEYIKNFRIILTAISEKRKVRIKFKSRLGNRQSWVIVPYTMEYSSKDDKFRVISAGGNHTITVNMARIRSCQLLEECSPEAYRPVSFKEKSLVLELTDERNALERVMLHFSHLEKETERMDNLHYRIRLFYKQEDETELLIRILSFGPVIKVTEPEDIIKQIRNRLNLQGRFMN